MIHIFDSELRIMDALWKNGPMTAGQLATLMKETCGWSRNTTYTITTRLIEKGAIARSDPGFLCTPLIDRVSSQHHEINLLVDRMFDGDRTEFMSAFLTDESVTPEEIDRIRELISKMK